MQYQNSRTFSTQKYINNSKLTNEEEVSAIHWYVLVKENNITSIENVKNILHMKNSKHH